MHFFLNHHPLPTPSRLYDIWKKIIDENQKKSWRMAWRKIIILIVLFNKNDSFGGKLIWRMVKNINFGGKLIWRILADF